MKTLKSLSSYQVQGKPCFALENPSACENFDHLIGEVVEIDGVRYKIDAVERYAHTPPFRAGERIGLQVSLPNEQLSQPHEIQSGAPKED